MKLTFFMVHTKEKLKTNSTKIIMNKTKGKNQKNETMAKFFTFIKQLKVYIRLFHFTVHMPIFPINRTIFNTTIHLRKDKREIWWHAYIQIVFILLY